MRDCSHLRNAVSAAVCPCVLLSSRNSVSASAVRMGKALLVSTQPADYAHLIVACLMHDIGYVRGILKDDGPDGFVVDAGGRKATLPRGASDAALLSYHVDRSKLFVLDRIGSSDRY